MSHKSPYADQATATWLEREREKASVDQDITRALMFDRVLSSIYAMSEALASAEASEAELFAEVCKLRAENRELRGWVEAPVQVQAIASDVKK